MPNFARERGDNRCVDILAPLFGHHVKEGLLRTARAQKMMPGFYWTLTTPRCASQAIALAPPQDLLAWIGCDGLSWLVREDVKSRTYAADDVWMTISQGNGIVRVESMMRDCVWDVSMRLRAYRSGC